MTGPETQRQLERLDRLATRLDSAFRIPFTGIRIGYDGLIGLIPGVGDTLALAPAAYILLSARRLGASTPVLLRMTGTYALDYAVGLVPMLGDVFDIGFKANRRNIAFLRQHLHEKGRVPSPATAPSQSGIADV
ncbi:DUF4112 domain-containing protein [Maritalea mobilis]|uniref:DUF4112 domain-containing protein n=1 Tax=Maritalea mobilis TaxID=483324 RepID=UPI001C945F83|nr:DUF4112 domain-containing protein [Maritalea mobilis]MBY6200585.1 DUF4112 domain-containing protein [Maritalea mobilis]